jgi:hypothetical protein
MELSEKTANTLRRGLYKNMLLLEDLKDVVHDENWGRRDVTAAGAWLAELYQSVETILKILLVRLYEQNISGDNAQWHRQLLRIAKEKGYVSDDIYFIMDELLSFRHFQRHQYSIDFDEDEIRQGIIDIIPAYVILVENMLKKHPILSDYKDYIPLSGKGEK